MSQPAQPEVLKLLGQAAQCLRAGQPSNAVPLLRRAAWLAPANAGILHDLGLACLESGLVAEAVGALQGSVAADPRFADAHLRLGIALEASGAVDAALVSYRTASDIRPALADARYRAGDLLDSVGQTAAAIASYRRAAASDPKTPLGRIATAKALLAENRDREAEKVLRQALAVEKGNAAALELLGHTLADTGRFAEAQTCFERAIERAPLRAGCYYDLVRCRRIGPEDGDLIARMRAAAILPGLEPAQRSRVHLALGKAANDLSDYQEAMRQFDFAAALRNTVTGFDLASAERRMERLIASFPHEVFARTAPGEHRDVTPVLIVGLPRSGTTLVEQILAAHPSMAAGGELPFWNERGAQWELGGPTIPDQAFLSGAASDYMTLMRGIARGGTHATDKMPLNFQWAGLIHLAVPNAVIIHCMRAPIDAALSIHQTHFNARMKFPTGGEALVGYIRAYQRVCAHWRQVLPPDRFIEIDYESLVDKPAAVIGRMLDACGLSWNDACLHPDLHARAVKTPSKWQARQPIYRTSVDRWRAYEPWLGALRALLEGGGDPPRTQQQAG